MNSVQEFISAWGGLMDAAVSASIREWLGNLPECKALGNSPATSGAGREMSQGVTDPGVRSTGEFLLITGVQCVFREAE